MFRFYKTSQPKKKYVSADLYGRRAVELRRHLDTRKAHKPESLMKTLLPEYQKIFKPVLNKNQKIQYRGFEFDVQDYGDYVRFRLSGHPKNANKRARIFFHGLDQGKMKNFPDFPNAKKDASFEKHYHGILRTIDAQNALSGVEDHSIDIIWHRGFWGAPDDSNLVAHHYIDENVNPNFRRRFVDNRILSYAKNDIEQQFGAGVFAPDIFARSAAFTLEKLQKEYKNIDILTHSMGNATLLEALDILDQHKHHQVGKSQKKAQFSALLTHPVPSTNHAVEGAKTEIQRQRSYDELLKYTRDMLYKILGYKDVSDAQYNISTPARILSLLNKGVQDGKITEAQSKFILDGVRKNDIAIIQGDYNLEPLNKAFEKAFPLIDQRHLRQYLTSMPKWQAPSVESWMLSGITEQAQANNSLSMMMALQPFCVSPFYDGKAERLLNEHFGEGRWKVFAGGNDELAPNPKNFLTNIFDFQNKNPAITLPKHAIQKEDLNKIQDKKLVIVQTGAHSTPVIQNNALHHLATRMYQ